MHILTVLGLLEQMELAVSDLYRHYAESLSHDREASAFFFRLYLDGRQHAAIVRYQRKVAWQNPHLFSETPDDIEEIQSAIVRARILTNDPDMPGLEEALSVAAEFESGAAEFHDRFTVRTCEAAFTKTVSKFCTAGINHTELIAEFSYQRGLCLSKGAKSRREAVSA